MNTTTLVALAIRHGLTFFGGFGVLAQDDITQIAGAVAAIVGVAWSVYEKRRKG